MQVIKDENKNLKFEVECLHKQIGNMESDLADKIDEIDCLKEQFNEINEEHDQLI